MPKHVKVNDCGRRIGEDHPRAVLLDHEVDLILDMLSERDALIAKLMEEGALQSEIDAKLTATGLSYRRLAEKFEVCKSCIAKIASGARRCQTAERLKPCP